MLQKYYDELVSANNWSKRRFIEKILAGISEEWDKKNIFIIEAPTGYGKSSISYAVAQYSFQKELKAIIVFPIRTLLEDQYNKFVQTLGSSTIALGRRYMEHSESMYLVEPITLTTIDTLSLTLFGIPPEEFERVAKSSWSGTSTGALGHYLFSYSSVLLANIVLDEVHLLADSTKSLNFLMLLIEEAVRNNQKLFLMSATIPTVLLEKIKNYKLKSNNEDLKNYLKIFNFNDEGYFDREFINERQGKRYQIIIEGLTEVEKFTKIMEVVNLGVAKGFKKIIAVFNTVSDAVQFYKILRDSLIVKDERILLLHSRFMKEDKSSKSEELEKIKKSGEYLIVTTQVIEAGFDISSNLFITEIAPANTLIQRLGRFLRYRETEGLAYIWFERDENNSLKRSGVKYKVYDLSLVDRTLKALIRNSEPDKFNKNIFSLNSSRLNFHVPESYKKFMDEVYLDTDFEINTLKIEKYMNILMDLEGFSSEAAKLFLELEGSFIRDEVIVPAIPRYFISEEQRLDEKIFQYVIPVSLSLLRNLKPLEVIVAEREKGENNLEYKKIKVEEALRNFSAPSSEILKQIYGRNIVAFIIEASYDKEFGLTKGD
ncbi:MAG: CRISPR-associated helicase Cas3' [Candidatus Odinarchaeum yellowstonii]|uniref:CRISPR-associated helicase Cas3 n=1 Tax=Odinarchaeota yellowstonii (strain LCB_4) TaxID=1841599 RepID=A0AAF0D241_ODILC|nr:MAG: CRISPR-associated helicase Cas3' [Candidatus Odinarchaeum yellowstonii]